MKIFDGIQEVLNKVHALIFMAAILVLRVPPEYIDKLDAMVWGGIYLFLMLLAYLAVPIIITAFFSILKLIFNS